MKKPSPHAIRRHLEALERRDVPALWNVPLPTGPLPTFEPAPDYGTITFANGTVTATGTQQDDFIQVHRFLPDLTPMFGPTGGWDQGFPGEQTVVAVMDAAGNVRTGADGAPLRQAFSPSSVTLVQVSGQGGNDRIENRTGHDTVLAGGEGNDSIQGGGGHDIVNGGGGDDSLAGGAGWDVMAGVTGNDRMSGEAGPDVLDGGDGSDILNGGEGHDTLNGEGGNDVLVGGVGDDSLTGWDGEDILAGEAGDDRLAGNLGNDFLYGGAGNDVLYGGAHNDDLEGGTGNDGLFGGSGRDSLNGGAGFDRFLKWAAGANATTVEDAQSGDSVTTFKDTTTTQSFSARGVTLRYRPAAWTAEQIEQVDGGLDFLHRETRNTRLLRLSGGGNVTFLRYGDYIPYNATDGNNDAKDQKANDLGPTFDGFNRGNGQIWFGTDTFVGPPEAANNTVHELAHNWDTENGRYDEWKALSGWKETTRVGVGQTLSRDGKWVYDSDAEFFRDYGKTNPHEDFATMFEAYYGFRDNSLTSETVTRLRPKLDFIMGFVARMGQ